MYILDISDLICVIVLFNIYFLRFFAQFKKTVPVMLISKKRNFEHERIFLINFGVPLGYIPIIFSAGRFFIVSSSSRKKKRK